MKHDGKSSSLDGTSLLADFISFWRTHFATLISQNEDLIKNMISGIQKLTNHLSEASKVLKDVFSQERFFMPIDFQQQPKQLDQQNEQNSVLVKPETSSDQQITDKVKSKKKKKTTINSNDETKDRKLNGVNKQEKKTESKINIMNWVNEHTQETESKLQITIR